MMCTCVSMLVVCVIFIYMQLVCVCFLVCVLYIQVYNCVCVCVCEWGMWIQIIGTAWSTCWVLVLYTSMHTICIANVMCYCFCMWTPALLCTASTMCYCAWRYDYRAQRVHQNTNVWCYGQLCWLGMYMYVLEPQLPWLGSEHGGQHSVGCHWVHVDVWTLSPIEGWHLTFRQSPGQRWQFDRWSCVQRSLQWYRAYKILFSRLPGCIM